MQRIYFVTNRNFVSAKASPWFGADLSRNCDLRIGYADFDMSKDPPTRKAMYVSPEKKKDSAETSTGKRMVPDFSLFGELKDKMSHGSPDTILFVHGFSYTFEEAVLGGALLKKRIDKGGGLTDPKTGAKSDANIVVFTWPSDGKMIPEISYYNDRHDAKSSGEAAGRALLQLWSFISGLKRKDQCMGRMHIAAHSMGNYALRYAIQSLVNYVPAPPPTLFNEILLLAADEDYDALELDYKLSPLSHLAKRIHVYYNPSDLALDVSVTTKGNPRRLGSRGPRNSAIIPDSVVLVDASDVSRMSDGDKDHHHYYLRSPEMAPDMAKALSGQPADKIPRRTPIPGRSGSFRMEAARKSKR